MFKNTEHRFLPKTFRGGHRESTSCPVFQWPQSIRQCKPTQFLSRGDKLAQMLGICITQWKSLLINDAKQHRYTTPCMAESHRYFIFLFLPPRLIPLPCYPPFVVSLPQRQRAPRNLLTHQMPKWDPDSYKSTLAASILQANPSHSSLTDGFLTPSLCLGQFWAKGKRFWHKSCQVQFIMKLHAFRLLS